MKHRRFGLFSILGRLHVTTKLMAAFAFLFMLTLLVSLVGLRSAATLERKSQSLFSEDLSGISAVKEVGIFQMKCTRTLRDLVLASGDKDTVEDQKQVLTELQSSVDEWMTAAQQAFADSSSKEKLKQISGEIPMFHAAAIKVAERAAAGDQKGALAALKEGNAISNRVNASIAEICREREDLAKAAQVENERTYKRSQIAMISCTAISLLFSIALSVLTLRMIARPLMKVLETLKKASDGDLTERLTISSQDEIGKMGQALNTALESTRMVLEHVRETVTSLGDLSQQLTATAQGMSQGAEAQASGLEKTSATLEQITATARNNAEHAGHAQELATHSRDAAQKGRDVVATATDAMGAISRSSDKISLIAEAMDEVAFQTNMLSVNAAIEAAGAGEHGRSFGVVAGEIRDLSRRSAESARKIRDLITESTTAVGQGCVSIDQSGDMLAQLSSSVNAVTDYVLQIASASREQSIGVDQLHSAVLQMSNVTQANVVQSSKLGAAAADLSGQALQLRSMLERFRL